MKSSPTTIRSVSRGAGLLTYVATQRGGATTTECARALGLSAPTAHHLLRTLATEGLLHQERSSRRFVIGPGAALLGKAFERQSGELEYLREPLRELVDETGETAYLAVWSRERIEAVASMEGANAVRVGEVDAGLYVNAHARATGKALLAFAEPDERDRYLDANPPKLVTPNTIVDSAELDQEFARIRALGYAEDLEEFVLGVACVSVPAVVGGVAVAAYTLSAPIERYRQSREAYLDAVRRSAATVSAGTPSGISEQTEAA